MAASGWLQRALSSFTFADLKKGLRRVIFQWSPCPKPSFLWASEQFYLMIKVNFGLVARAGVCGMPKAAAISPQVRPGTSWARRRVLAKAKFLRAWWLATKRRCGSRPKAQVPPDGTASARAVLRR